MAWDRDDADTRAKHRDHELARYVRHELAAYSPDHRRRLFRAGVETRAVKGLADLGRVTPTDWADVEADPSSFLLRPEEGDIARHGDRRLVWAITRARLLRRHDHVNREIIDPQFKPVHWHLDHGVPIGSTGHDLDRLGEAGSRMLQVAGLSRYDVLVGVGQPGPHLAYWQTVLGARTAQVPALHLGPDAAPDLVAGARPTVLAGDPASLEGVLARLVTAGAEVPELHTVIATGERLDAGWRDALLAAAEQVSATPDPPAVVAAWAPRGARALWAECREGPGFHTYPDFEILEVADDQGRMRLSGRGELVWTALGWRGTAFVRLRTGEAVTLVDQVCPACSRQGPMIVTGDRRRPALALRALGGHDEVSAFQVELRNVDGEEEIVVFLAPERGADLAEVLADVDTRLHATQYVVLTRREIERKVAAAGSRIVDLR
jgi:hypothetical protein